MLSTSGPNRRSFLARSAAIAAVPAVAALGGAPRDEQGGWLPGNSPQSLREQVHDNLRLGLERVLDVV